MGELATAQDSSGYDLLIKTAISKDADVDKLQRLMEMKERWEAGEAKKAYIEAMTNFRAACPRVVKDKQSHNATYASLQNIERTITPALSANGLSHSFSFSQGENNAISVTCTITHIAGHSESVAFTSYPDDGGKMNTIQRAASATTYMKRYTLSAITGVTAHDDDDDGNQAADRPITSFDGFLMLGNSLGMYLLFHTHTMGRGYMSDLDDPATQAWLGNYQNLPAGFKGKIKQRIESMIEEGRVILTSIEQYLLDEDAHGLYELTSDLDGESRKLLAKHIGDDDTKKLKTLLEEVEA